MALGAATEVIAAALGLWRYRSAWLATANVIVMFGAVQGVAFAWAVGGGQAPVAIAPVLFTLGALAGIYYEALNHFLLKAWTWPDASLLGLRRAIDKAAAVGVAWGFVPVLTTLLARAPFIAGAF
jgi:hypothetical protein